MITQITGRERDDNRRLLEDVLVLDDDVMQSLRVKYPEHPFLNAGSMSTGVFPRYIS